jgi:hypothetical protein
VFTPFLERGKIHRKEVVKIRLQADARFILKTYDEVRLASPLLFASSSEFYDAGFMAKKISVYMLAQYWVIYIAFTILLTRKQSIGRRGG